MRLSFRWPSVFVVFRKELRETLRDRKTLLITYGLPLVVYPLTTILGSEAVSVQVDKMRREDLQVALVGEAIPPLAERIQAIPKLKLVEIPPISDEKSPETRRLFKERNLRAIVVTRRLTPGAGALGNFESHILYDETNMSSQRAADKLTTAIEGMSLEIRDRRLASQGLNAAFFTPMVVTRRGLAGEERVIGKAVGTGAPYLIFILLCLAAYYPALNATVGERERGTLATLMTTPLHPSELIIGKFLNVFLNCITGVATYALSLGACSWILLGGLKLPAFFNSPAYIPLVLVSAAMAVSAMSVMIGLFARKFSEGQALLSLFMLLVAFPALIVAAADIKLSLAVAFIPIMNVASLVKGFAVDHVDPLLIAVTCASNLAFGVALLAFASDVLRGEYQAETQLSDLMSLRRDRIKSPTPGLSLALFGAVAALALYANFALARQSVHLTTFLTEVAIIAGIPLAVSRWFRLDLRESFQLRLPPASAWPLSVLLGLGLAIIMAQLESLTPIPKELTEEFSKRLGFDKPDTPLAPLWLSLAILPGVCEEFLFRGIVLKGLLKRFAPLWAISIDAVLFGIIHFSLIRFAPTALVGAALAFVAWRTRSVLPGMLAHLLYNGILITVSRHAGQLGKYAWLEDGFTPGLFAAGVGAVALCLALLQPVKKAVPQVPH